MFKIVFQKRVGIGVTPIIATVSSLQLGIVDPRPQL